MISHFILTNSYFMQWKYLADFIPELKNRLAPRRAVITARNNKPTVRNKTDKLPNKGMRNLLSGII